MNITDISAPGSTPGTAWERSGATPRQTAASAASTAPASDAASTLAITPFPTPVSTPLAHSQPLVGSVAGDAPDSAGGAPPQQRWRRSQWLLWGAVPLAALGAWLPQQPEQRDWFLQLNQFAAAHPPSLWATCTLLGDTAVLFTALSPLLLWRPQALMAAMAAVPAGGLISVVAKRLADAPRPAAVLDLSAFNLIGPALGSHSFPSGHAITAFAAAAAVLATTVPSLRNRTGGVLLGLGLAAAGAIAFSRVAVGAHWPVDVLVGAGAGWLAGLSGALITRLKPQWWQPLSHQRALAAGLAMTGVWLAWRPLDYPQGAPAIWLAVVASLGTAALMLSSWWRERRAVRAAV